MQITADILQRAEDRALPWRVGNDVLYELCRTRPTHADMAEVIAKIWLIGRSYAAAIERRKNKSETNDDFYEKTVAPVIMGSSIDAWINRAKRYERPCEESWDTLLQVHHDTTKLFRDISDLEKRSLASKYLHFHVPKLFYIYDTRAAKALRSFPEVVRRAGRSGAKTDTQADNEYRKFAEKCFSLQQHIEQKFGVTLSPRELDNLLLQGQGKSV